MASPPGHVPKERIAAIRIAAKLGGAGSVGLEELPRLLPKCEATTPERHYKGPGRCPRTARFLTHDGDKLCQVHAYMWAARRK